MKSRTQSSARFWGLFGLLFLLMATEGGIGLKVLADFKRSVEALNRMQDAGMRIDRFGLLLNNYIKETRVSTGLEQQAGELVALPPTSALAAATADLESVQAGARPPELDRLIEGTRALLAGVARYGESLRLGQADEATVLFLQDIEPLADRLLADDFPASREAIQAGVQRVSEENRRAGVFAFRVLVISLVATLAVGLFLARLIWAALERAKSQERELERRASELAVARTIQTAVLPREFHLPGYDVAAVMLTAEEVGGDFYEFRPSPDGGAWLAIGDVTGHGLKAGVVMLMAQSMFTMLSGDEGDSPRDLITRLNRSLFYNMKNRLGEDKFMTMVVARLHADGRMTCAGAHTDLLIYRSADRKVERIATEGLWLGVTEDVSQATVEQELQLLPGDVALFHTDGVTEARDGQGRVFDIDRLAVRLAESSHLAAAGLVEKIAAVTLEWAPIPADDVSLMAIKRS